MSLRLHLSVALLVLAACDGKSTVATTAPYGSDTASAPTVSPDDDSAAVLAGLVGDGSLGESPINATDDEATD